MEHAIQAALLDSEEHLGVRKLPLASKRGRVALHCGTTRPALSTRACLLCCSSVLHCCPAAAHWSCCGSCCSPELRPAIHWSVQPRVGRERLCQHRNDARQHLRNLLHVLRQCGLLTCCCIRCVHCCAPCVGGLSQLLPPRVYQPYRPCPNAAPVACAIAVHGGAHTAGANWAAHHP